MDPEMISDIILLSAYENVNHAHGLHWIVVLDRYTPLSPEG